MDIDDSINKRFGTIAERELGLLLLISYFGSFFPTHAENEKLFARRVAGVGNHTLEGQPSVRQGLRGISTQFSIVVVEE